MTYTLVRSKTTYCVVAIIILSGFLLKTKWDDKTEVTSKIFPQLEQDSIAQVERQSDYEVNHQVDESLSSKSTLDCQSWKSIDYKTVKTNKSEKIEINDDANDERLEILTNVNHFDEFSGVGSTIFASKNFRSGLEKIIDFLKSELKKDRISILDSSCGDMVWMPLFLRSRSDVDYTGYDLIPAIIDKAKQKFSNETWNFYTFDLVKDKIETQFDLLINRHTAIHLGIRDNIQMFHNFHQSGSKYLMTTTFPTAKENTNLYMENQRKDLSRRFHEVNLVLPPFLFPVPICQSIDSSPEQFYALWHMSSLDSFEQRNKEFIRSFNE